MVNEYDNDGNLKEFKRVYENPIEDKTEKPLFWKDESGVYKIGYSQKLQEEDIKVKEKIEKVLKRIKWIGLIGIIILVLIAIFLGVIVFTDVLQNTLRNMVC